MTARCMPWPLALLCLLDSRAHGRRDWDAPPGRACHVHDRAIRGWCWLRGARG